MLLIKQGDAIEDNFRALADDEALPEAATVMVSLARWQAERDMLIQRNAPLGLRLKSSESPLILGDDVHRFAAIAIEFPTFKDGRGFSYARRLREQMGYDGELRAVGHLIPDQAQFLARVGFDTVEVKDDANLASWARGFSDFSVFYQTAADRLTPVFHLRQMKQAAE